MKLLALDTASAQCSVALLVGDDLLIRAVVTPREHALLLLPMVDELLSEAGLNLRALDGLAFGRGPGSFTGVRIAASVTQGLAAGADLPVLPISSLRALAEAVRTALPATIAGGQLLACMDARMGELYWGVFDHAAGCTGPAHDGERLSTPAEMLEQLGNGAYSVSAVSGAAGMGLGAYPELAAQLGLDPERCFPRAEPHAREIARLAVADLACGALWLDAAAAQPVYLRNKVVRAPL